MSDGMMDAPAAGRGRKSIPWHAWVALAARLAVGGVFIYAAAGKIADPAQFARAIYAYRILHADLVNLAAIWLPWTEALAGTLLVVGLGRRSAGAVTSGLMVVFIGAAGLGVLRGLSVECGCFMVGSAGARLGWWVLARDVVLLAASLLATLHPSNLLALDALAEPKPARPEPAFREYPIRLVSANPSPTSQPQEYPSAVQPQQGKPPEGDVAAGI